MLFLMAEWADPFNYLSSGIRLAAAILV